MVNIGKMKRVAIRDIWPNEETNFTPWLRDNLGQLGDALGIDLEVQESEASVGRYSLDLLARDSGTGRKVIIENQLGPTDHTHLGQCLTYAAGHQAGVVVWIAPEFRDEHRDTLKYLNDRTEEDTKFFGVVFETWQIDDSCPGVKFKLVVAPDSWQRRTSQSGTSDTGSVSRERYWQFFQRLADTLREEHRFTGVPKALPENWYYLSFSAIEGNGQGISGYVPKFSASFSDGTARVDLLLNAGGRRGRFLFDWLQKRKGRIEADLNLKEPLDWNQPKHKIGAVRLGSIEHADDERLEELREWMVDRLLAFRRVFDPMLQGLIG